MMKELDRVLDASFLLVRGAMACVDALRRFLGLGPVRATLRTLALGALHAFLFLGVSWTFLHRVRVGEVGVRERLLGNAGLEQRDHGPGMRAGVRWLEAWHHLDARTHVLQFGVDAGPDGEPALELRTRDGNLVQVSAAVLYSIRPGEAWRLVAAGLEHSYDALARRAVADVLGTELAGLASRDFWDADLRQAATARARGELERRLGALFLAPETIQITEVEFPAEYEAALALERSEREGVRVAQAMQRLEEELRGDPGLDVIDTEEELSAEEARIRAELQRDLELERSSALLEIARIERESESYVALRESESESTHERELAAGRLALDQAEAARERGLAAALEGRAGRLWLARQAASSQELRRALRDALDPRVPSPFDVDQVVRFLLGEVPETPSGGSGGR